LLRRRTLRRDESIRDAQGREVLFLGCSRRDKVYEVISAEPSPDKAQELQAKILDLLYAGSEPVHSSTLKVEEVSNG
jgi:hypothetical protein